MIRLDVASKWILVTGASSGLGAEIAKNLALRHHANLLLVARRTERMESLKTQIQNESDVQIELLGCDLSSEAECQRALSWAREHSNLGGAVLNAGMTYYGEHNAMPPETQQQLLDVNVVSTAYLASGLLQHWRQLEIPAGLLLVSSLGGHIPLPYQALYSGTKGFISNFGIALAAELRGLPQSVTVFAPGGIATEMIDKSGLDRLPGGKYFNRDAKSCAAIAVNALLRRRLLASSSWADYILLNLGRAIPYQLGNRFLKSLYAKGIETTGCKGDSRNVQHARFRSVTGETEVRSK